MKTMDADVLIIGAGPAGAVAAASLHRDGVKALVVEKQRFPRFVIGESLLPRTMNLLDEVGLLPAVEARGFIHKTGALFCRGEQRCDFDFRNQSSLGWKYTFQVTRAEFDQAIADEVASRGVEFLYGHGVAGVRFAEDCAEAEIEQPDGQRRTVRAKFILDCSGYGRVLPRLLDLELPSHFPTRDAIFAHVTGDRRPSGYDEGKIWACIHADGAWLWIIPFSNGRTSVGVVATPEFFARYEGDAEAQFRAMIAGEPNAAGRLGDMQLVFAPQRIKGFACSIKRLYGPRFALAGNATEFLDPIFSSGVTLAMESGLRAAQLLAREARGESVDWQADYADFLMQGMNTFRAFVTAWYDGRFPEILFSERRNPEVIPKVCSVLAGYVWDMENPFVAQPDRALQALATIANPKFKRKSL